MPKKKLPQDPCGWDFDFTINSAFTPNSVHQSFQEVIVDRQTKMVFADGPAGTAKTYLAVQSALQMLKRNYIDSIIYIRSVVESASQKMGSLPGEVDDKFLPWSIPLIEKLDELVGIPTRYNLMDKHLVECVPVNYVRGLTFNDKVVIVDEAQNMTTSELTTILTRFGKNSRYIVVGDAKQSDINGKSGFKPIFDCFDDTDSEDNGIYTFKFSEEEIVRSKILRFIVKQLDKLRL